MTKIVPYVNYTDALAKIRKDVAGLTRQMTRKEMEAVPTEATLAFLRDKTRYSDDFMRAHVYLAVNIEIGRTRDLAKVKIRGNRSDLRGALLSRIGVKRSRASSGPVRMASDLLVRQILKDAADALRAVSPDEIRRRIEVILVEDKARHDGEMVNQAKDMLVEIFMGRGAMIDIDEIIDIQAKCMARTVLST